MERKTVVGTGGELLVHQLLAQGVDYVFTNTGSAEAGLLQRPFSSAWCAAHLTPDGPLVLSAADGYGKIADKPAFVNVHLAAGTRQARGSSRTPFLNEHPWSSPRPCATLAPSPITSRWARAVAFSDGRRGRHY